MQIMCLNAWGGALHAPLLHYLHSTQPDVLCLQEVVHSPASHAATLTYRDGKHILPQRANLFTEVSAALPEHSATFCPAAQGVLWDDDQPIPSQSGLATFVHRRLTVTGQVQDFVHKDFSPDGYGTHPRARSAHGLRLYDHAGGRFVSIAQMHGLWDPCGKVDTPERSVQARRLLALSDRVSGPGDLRVICGDFNVAPDSETLRLLRDAGFTELVTERGFAGTRSTHYEKPGRFADYMLISQPEAARAFDVVYHPEVSDHCPLVLTV